MLPHWDRPFQWDSPKRAKTPGPANSGLQFSVSGACLAMLFGEEDESCLMKPNKCAHPACKCQARPDSKYCSQSCEDAAGTTEISCNCGHPGCALTE
jgi:hypothetical protein